VGAEFWEPNVQPGDGIVDTKTKPSRIKSGSAGLNEAAIQPDRVGAESTCTDSFKSAFSWVKDTNWLLNAA
jgi:hypothetical protein